MPEKDIGLPEQTWPYDEDYWGEGDRPPCAEDEHCFSETSGDIGYAGEPTYEYGLVWTCSACGEERVFPNPDITRGVYRMDARQEAALYCNAEDCFEETVPIDWDGFLADPWDFPRLCDGHMSELWGILEAP